MGGLVLSGTRIHIRRYVPMINTPEVRRGIDLSAVTLILWIWLIYNRGRLLFAALATAFVAEITSVIALLAMSMPAEYGTS